VKRYTKNVLESRKIIKNPFQCLKTGYQKILKQNGIFLLWFEL